MEGGRRQKRISPSDNQDLDECPFIAKRCPIEGQEMQWARFGVRERRFQLFLLDNCAHRRKLPKQKRGFSKRTAISTLRGKLRAPRCTKRYRGAQATKQCFGDKRIKTENRQGTLNWPRPGEARRFSRKGWQSVNQSPDSMEDN